MPADLEGDFEGGPDFTLGACVCIDVEADDQTSIPIVPSSIIFRGAILLPLVGGSCTSVSGSSNQIVAGILAADPGSFASLEDFLESYVEEKSSNNIIDLKGKTMVTQVFGDNNKIYLDGNLLMLSQILGNGNIFRAVVDDCAEPEFRQFGINLFGSASSISLDIALNANSSSPAPPTVDEYFLSKCGFMSASVFGARTNLRLTGPGDALAQLSVAGSESDIITDRAKYALTHIGVGDAFDSFAGLDTKGTKVLVGGGYTQVSVRTPPLEAETVTSETHITTLGDSNCSVSWAIGGNSSTSSVTCNGVLIDESLTEQTASNCLPSLDSNFFLTPNPHSSCICCTKDGPIPGDCAELVELISTLTLGQ
jgi:hypothetical protein